MQIHINQKSEHIIVGIEGSLDASSSIELDEFFKKNIASGTSKFIVNCETLEYISSAGLGVFISYLDEITEKKGYIVFFGLSPTVKNVFEILGLAQVLPIKNTLEDAESFVKENFS